MPRGGFYLWCRLPDGRDAADVARAALRENVVLAPGNVFSVSQSASALHALQRGADGVDPVSSPCWSGRWRPKARTVRAAHYLNMRHGPVSWANRCSPRRHRAPDLIRGRAGSRRHHHPRRAPRLSRIAFHERRSRERPSTCRALQPFVNPRGPGPLYNDPYRRARRRVGRKPLYQTLFRISLLWSSPKRQLERRASAFGVADGDLAAEARHQLSCDRQAETCARRRLALAPERLENELAIRFRDPFAMVDDFDNGVGPDADNHRSPSHSARSALSMGCGDRRTDAAAILREQGQAGSAGLRIRSGDLF